MKQYSTDPREDIQTIRDIMERSSRFLSLSGLSGIVAGFCALAGAAVAWFFILGRDGIPYGDYPGDPGFSSIRFYLILDAVAVLGLAMSGALWFSRRKARRSGQRSWTPASRRLLAHLLIPLATGGLFILILLHRNRLELVAPAMLIFYGLSLVGAAKFTFGEIRSLGLAEIALGLIAALFPAWGLAAWTLGFGVLHIIYGAVMYRRHDVPGPQRKGNRDEEDSMNS